MCFFIYCSGSKYKGRQISHTPLYLSIAPFLYMYIRNAYIRVKWTYEIIPGVSISTKILSTHISLIYNALTRTYTENVCIYANYIHMYIHALYIYYILSIHTHISISSYYIIITNKLHT